MPKIITITIAHMLLMLVSGFFIGMLVFGVGFSGSTTVKEGYAILVWLWKILNAPASFFSDVNIYLYLFIQLITSFIWANIFAICWSVYKTRSHD